MWNRNDLYQIQDGARLDLNGRRKILGTKLLKKLFRIFNWNETYFCFVIFLYQTNCPIQVRLDYQPLFGKNQKTDVYKLHCVTQVGRVTPYALECVYLFEVSRKFLRCYTASSPVTSRGDSNNRRDLSN